MKKSSHPMQLTCIVALMAVVRGSSNFLPSCNTCVSIQPGCPPGNTSGCKRCLYGFKQINYMLEAQTNQDAEQVTEVFCNMLDQKNAVLERTDDDITVAYKNAQDTAQTATNRCISQALDVAMTDTIIATEALVEGLLPILETQMNTAIIAVNAAFTTLGAEPDADIAAQLVNSGSVFWQAVTAATDNLISAMASARTDAISDSVVDLNAIFANARVDYTACINTTFTTFSTAVANSITAARVSFLAQLSDINDSALNRLFVTLIGTTNRTIDGIRSLMAACSTSLSGAGCP